MVDHDDHRLESLGTQIRARRRALHLTQAELADLAGCSERFVYALEQGKPSVHLGKVLDVLGVLGLGLRVEPGSGTVTTASSTTESQ